MSTDFVVDAQTRKVQGSGASRRLRNAGKVPAILYGGEAAPVMLEVDHNEMFKHLRNEAFFSHILTVKVDGKPQKAVLRDLQRHPVKPLITHMDFLRVSANEAIRVSVPLHFVNEETCKGVKTGGGIINRQIIEVEVECLPADLPEFLEADLQDVGVGDSLHLSSLKLPEGVTIVAFLHGEAHDHDQPVASVVKPRGEKAANADGEVEDADADADSSAESDD